MFLFTNTAVAEATVANSFARCTSAKTANAAIYKNVTNASVAVKIV